MAKDFSEAQSIQSLIDDHDRLDYETGQAPGKLNGLSKGEKLAIYSKLNTVPATIIAAHAPEKGRSDLCVQLEINAGGRRAMAPLSREQTINLIRLLAGSLR